MEYCESIGHNNRKATHKRKDIMGKGRIVYMCYECADTANEIDHELDVEELSVPGHAE